MVITESELRELWRDGRNALPAFPVGTRFSPAAQDFLKDHQLEVRWAEARPVTLAALQPLSVTNDPLPFALDTLAWAESIPQGPHEVLRISLGLGPFHRGV